MADAIAVCGSCHSVPPTGGAPMPLRTDADLRAASKTAAPDNPSRMLTYAELSVMRMQDANRPMPPTGPTSTQAKDIAALQGWIAAGYPAGSCGVSDAGVPQPTVCTSGTFTTGEDIPDRNLMHPGGACNTCHGMQTRERPPIFSIAGTVYSTYREKDDCNAAPSVRGSQVIITGADGRVLTLTVNATGNFLTQQRVALPFQAKVVQNGKEHVMQTPQSVGECNTCHTEQGANGAPGRITAP